jgi:hypothetical protein
MFWKETQHEGTIASPYTLTKCFQQIEWVDNTWQQDDLDNVKTISIAHYPS